jgi:hypothetical protein
MTLKKAASFGRNASMVLRVGGSVARKHWRWHCSITHCSGRGETRLLRACAFDVLAVDAVRAGPSPSSGRARDEVDEAGSLQCGWAGSMLWALRFQEGWTSCAGLSEATPLVQSKQLMEGAIGWVGLDRSTGTHRVVGWVWADTLIQEAAGPRLDAHLAW